LTDLDLSANNQIGAVGAKAIADALQHNSCLNTLNLGYNKIGDDGAKAIADALKHNSCLSYLGLGKNKIGVVGAKAFTDALQHNSCLTDLRLVGNNFDINSRHDSLINECLERNRARINELVQKSGKQLV